MDIIDPDIEFDLFLHCFWEFETQLECGYFAEMFIDYIFQYRQKILQDYQQEFFLEDIDQIFV